MSETKFVKTKKERNYTVLDNTFIQDTSLSWKAKGLMTYFLSLPDDWVIHFSEIEKHATDGKASLRSAINELKEKGYLKAEQRRVDNRFAEMIYTIIENPAETSPLTDFQKTGNQKTEKQETENQTLQNTNKDKVLKEQSTNNNSDKPKSDFQIVVDTYFQNFKNLYTQKRVNTEKPYISMKVAGSMINRLLSEIGKEKILMALDKAILDSWIVEQGYSLTTILSANQLNKLLNAKTQTEAPKNFNKAVLEERDFFANVL